MRRSRCLCVCLLMRERVCECACVCVCVTDEDVDTLDRSGSVGGFPVQVCDRSAADTPGDCEFLQEAEQVPCNVDASFSG